jgi:8-oxo-dGTP pyrophosphatase MutT (NUDIX family)
MTDDLIEVFDNHDRVIGLKPKDECHRDGDRHGSVTGIVFLDPEYVYVLLGKRANREGIISPGLYCFSGGHLKPGELPKDGTGREFAEEYLSRSELPSGIITFEEIFHHEKSRDNDNESMAVSRGFCPGPFNPNPREVSDIIYGRFVHLVRDTKFHPGRYTKTTIDLVNKYNGMFR